MIRDLFAAAFAGLFATQAMAAPCVSATFDQLYPGATGVTSYVTDVPSSTFPAFWQEGRIEGFAYKMFANATAVLSSDNQGQPWQIDVICRVAAQTCTISETGPAPDVAMQMAKQMGQCLIPTWGAKGEPRHQSAQKEEKAVRLDEPIAEEGSAECGLSLVDDATEIAKMQQLLILLGEDPGPVDGFLGPQTFAAMAPYIENPGWGTPLLDALFVLSGRHCRQLRDSM